MDPLTLKPKEAKQLPFVGILINLTLEIQPIKTS
jgi:hypothetical protein